MTFYRRYILFFCLLFSAYAQALLGPEYLYFNQLVATVGANPCVKIDNPVDSSSGDTSLIVLHVCSDEMAKGLALLLSPNDYVSIEIRNSSEVAVDGIQLLKDLGTSLTLDELIGFVNSAFTGNPFFSQTIKRANAHQPPFNYPDLVIEWNKAVVQYFSEDRSDYYLSSNDVASNAFKALLVTQFPGGLTIGFTTKK